jgi:hypothetical protein
MGLPTPPVVTLVLPQSDAELAMVLAHELAHCLLQARGVFAYYCRRQSPALPWVPAASSRPTA